MIKTLKTFDLKNKRVLLRVDYNVPLENNRVIDDFRIKQTLPTIKYCLDAGAKIIIMSHLGRPNGKYDPNLSLMPIGESLADCLEMPIKFSDDCISEDSHNVTLGLKPGEIHMLENLRFHEDETTNNADFCALLAKHGDIFINDAFGMAHRSHASNVGIAKNFSRKGIGFLFEKELNFLSKILSKPPRPITLLLGGAKINTKVGLIDHYIGIADQILIGGGMAFTLLKARGLDIGNSIIDESKISSARQLIEKAKKKKNIFLPKDVVCSKSIKKSASSKVYDITKIPKGQMGLDIGPKTIDSFSSLISNSKTVIWNGPMGVFELDNFDNGTKSLAKHIASCTEGGLISIIGGGDTASALRKFNLDNKMTHLSTGGGASIELLSGKNLPAIFALEV
ncbi:MAG: phosphoglycerate kinase [Candidatus Neomarinimicrobiota bacterium]